MKITINNITFPQSGWSVYENVGHLDIMTNESLVNILNTISENQPIEVYSDEDELLSIWNNNGVKSIKSDTVNDTRRVTIDFDVSIISSNAEAQLYKDIDESINGILELGTVVAEIDETLQSHAESINGLSTAAEATNENIELITSQINDLSASIRASLDEFQNNYNLLADRVAQLENGG